MTPSPPPRGRRRVTRAATREGEPFEPVPERQVVRELGLDRQRSLPAGDDPLRRQRAERPPHWE